MPQIWRGVVRGGVNMDRITRLRQQLKQVISDIEYNRAHGLDNSDNYELYEYVMQEIEDYYNEY